MEDAKQLILNSMFIYFMSLGILYDVGKYNNGEKLCSVITNRYEFADGCDKKKSPRKMYLSPNELILYNAAVEFLKNKGGFCSSEHSVKKKGNLCCHILKGCFYGSCKITYVNCLYFKPHVVKIMNGEVPRNMYATKMEMEHLKLFLNKVEMFPSIEFKAIVDLMGGHCKKHVPDIIVIEAPPATKKRHREIIYDDVELEGESEGERSFEHEGESEGKHEGESEGEHEGEHEGEK